MENDESIVKNESKRQLVILVFGAVGLIVSISIGELSDPVNRKHYKMLAALKTKRTAQLLADKFQTLAGWAATIYNREKA